MYHFRYRSSHGTYSSHSSSAPMCALSYVVSFRRRTALPRTYRSADIKIRLCNPSHSGALAEVGESFAWTGVTLWTAYGLPHGVTGVTTDTNAQEAPLGMHPTRAGLWLTGAVVVTTNIPRTPDPFDKTPRINPAETHNQLGRHIEKLGRNNSHRQRNTAC
jgi:hypothetical protein